MSGRDTSVGDRSFHVLELEFLLKGGPAILRHFPELAWRRCDLFQLDHVYCPDVQLCLADAQCAQGLEALLRAGLLTDRLF